MTTIKDIAKLAGVAPSTVSRVIADSPKISEKTKRKVRKIMDELDYHPNFTARNLVNNSTQTIGIVLKDSTTKSLHNPFFPEVIQGISEALQSRGYSMALTTGETESEVYDNVVRMVRSGSVDGLILLYSKENDPVVPFLQENNCRFVVIGRPAFSDPNIIYVDNDNIRAGIEVTEYLVQLGHRRLAFIGGDLKYQVNHDRLKGFMNVVQTSGLPYHEEETLYVGFHYKEGEKIVDKLLAHHDPITAIVVVDDITASSIINACYERGIKVPDDLSIVSFNNSVVSELSRPPQTTVDIHSFQLGYEAATSVIEYINTPNRMKKNIIVPTTLIERKSCKCYEL